MSATLDTMIERAASIGNQHGACSAEWVNISGPDHARTVLAGIEECDPLIMDELPAPDLSGQWAGGYSPRDLLTEVDAESIEDPSEVLNAYEIAFSDAVEACVSAHCRNEL